MSWSLQKLCEQSNLPKELCESLIIYKSDRYMEINNLLRGDKYIGNEEIKRGIMEQEHENVKEQDYKNIMNIDKALKSGTVIKKRNTDFIPLYRRIKDISFIKQMIDGRYGFVERGYSSTTKYIDSAVGFGNFIMYFEKPREIKFYDYQEDSELYINFQSKSKEDEILLERDLVYTVSDLNKFFEDLEKLKQGAIKTVMCGFKIEKWNHNEEEKMKIVQKYMDETKNKILENQKQSMENIKKSLESKDLVLVVVDNIGPEEYMYIDSIDDIKLYIPGYLEDLKNNTEFLQKVLNEIVKRKND